MHKGQGLRLYLKQSYPVKEDYRYGNWCNKSYNKPVYGIIPDLKLTSVRKFITGILPREKPSEEDHNEQSAKRQKDVCRSGIEQVKRIQAEKFNPARESHGERGGDAENKH